MHVAKPALPLERACGRQFKVQKFISLRMGTSADLNFSPVGTFIFWCVLIVSVHCPESRMKGEDFGRRVSRGLWMSERYCRDQNWSFYSSPLLLTLETLAHHTYATRGRAAPAPIHQKSATRINETPCRSVQD